MLSDIYQVGEKPIPKEEYLTKHNLYDLPLASIADYFEVSDNPEFQIEQLDKWLSRIHLGSVEENCIVLSSEIYLQSEYFRLGYQEYKEITKQLNSISYERFVKDYDGLLDLLYQACQRISDVNEDYVCWNSKTPIPISEFLRKAESDTPYYIGGICEYHY